MAKKKRKNPTLGSAIEPKPAPRIDVAAPEKQRSMLPWPWLALIGFVGTAVWAAWSFRAPAVKPGEVTAEQRPQAPFRALNTCRRGPEFIVGLGFSAAASVSTAERDVLGIAIVDFDPQSKQRSKVWQHPSWRQAGQLSAFAMDRNGDIYAIPAPRVNLADNPPALQNRLYRIDSRSAEMSLALEFPIAAPANARNPFAGMGLSYDCEDHALWLSSVAGSTPTQQQGRIMQIALAPKPSVQRTRANIDGFAIARVRSAEQSGVLLGDARSGALFWYALDAQGAFQGEALRLLSIDGLGPLGNERIRKIDIATDGTLTLHGTSFQFNLAQPAAQRKPTHYRYVWNAQTLQYQFAGWQ
jgi:hypothetical protein